MFSDLIDALNAADVGVWMEVSGIKSHADVRVKQINLIGLVRQRQSLGAGYRLTTRTRQEVNGEWSLQACKVEAKKKGKWK